MGQETAQVLVIGGGAAGLAAAYRLAARFRVTLIEAENRLGGHAWTWTVPDGPDAGLPLDLGFMVLNDRNYPTLVALFEEWGGIEIAETEMSFGYWDEDSAFGYAVNGAAPTMPLEAEARTLLAQALKFQRRASADLSADRLDGISLAEYLDRAGLSRELVRHYIVPMGAAIWSSAPDTLGDYPAASFLAFFANHGLLSVERPPCWRQVTGGSRRYVERLIAARPALRVIKTAARRLERHAAGVTLRLADGTVIEADCAVLATQADQALALLADPAPEEVALLGPWRYQTNLARLHTDPAAMPVPYCQASWNVRRPPGSERLVFTYDLNRLQNHRTAQNRYFLSLAQEKDLFSSLDPARLLLATQFRHPVFDEAATRAVRSFDPGGSHRHRTYFCGSYFGYGFHEDAVRSGTEAAALVEVRP